MKIKNCLTIHLWFLIVVFSCKMGEELRGNEALEPLIEEVTFQCGEIKLASSLVLPDKKGPHPAIVMVPGSGPQGRNPIYLRIAKAFAQCGIAVIMYDKPGVGKSTGDWQVINFYGRARIANAAVEYLHTRSDIDAKKVGLWGMSQGCWINAIAAASNAKISFIVQLSGGSVSPEAQELWDDEYNLRKNGFDEAVITRALELLKRENHYYRTGEGKEELLADLKKVRKERWYGFTELPGSEWNRRRGRGGEVVLPPYEKAKVSQKRESLDFNPSIQLAQVRCPVYVLLGSMDHSTPAEQSERAYRKVFKKSGQNNISIRVFEGLGHDLGLRSGETDTEVIKMTIDWVLKQTKETEENP